MGNDFEGYEVRENGDVWSVKKQKVLKWQDNSNGYKKVIFWVNGKYKNHYIHRLVAAKYVPNPNNYKYVDHIDRNKENNNYTNLRWVSAKENTANIADKPRYSACRKGWQAYDKELIATIKQEYIDGSRVMELAKKHGIPRQSISRFVKS